MFVLRPTYQKLFLFISILFFSSANQSLALNWQVWNESHFETAKKDKKLILLNLEAVWCHWCHVMEEKTYKNPEVAKLLNEKFISIKVDQDSKPDLSTRYEKWGWPATIIFNNEGQELKKLAGYIAPDEMLKILNEAIKNPSVTESEEKVVVPFVTDAALSASYRAELESKHYNSMDTTLGGLRTNHKYLDFDTLEWALIMASKNSERDAAFAKLSLKSNIKLIDPIWGGVYQYSTNRDWEHPHFEKIVPSQSNNIKLYSYAYSLWGEEDNWRAATNIYSYIKLFLTSPDGAFYTSQDADLIKGKHSSDYFKLNDLDRRAKGIPAIDKNIYSRENGLIISAFVSLYSATLNRSILDEAIKAADWIEKNRSIPGNGFSHGVNDIGGPFLGDSLSMAKAFLNIYVATGDRVWLTKAEQTAKFIKANFADKSSNGELIPGLFVNKPVKSSILKPLKNLADNLDGLRFFNLLGHYTGNIEYIDVAKSIMKYVATPESATGSINESGILVADYEITRDPLHITIVGQKDDLLAKELFNAGLKYFAPYKRLEWWDKREGPMPNPDVEYPQMHKSAAFICTNKRCSLPIFKAEGISDTIKLFHKDEK